MKVHISNSTHEVPILHIDMEHDLIVIIVNQMPT